MQYYGMDALVRIISHLAFIYLAFWGLRAVRLETLFRSFNNRQIRLVMTLVAIVLGYQASSFFLEVLALCRNLFYSFQ